MKRVLGLVMLVLPGAGCAARAEMAPPPAAAAPAAGAPAEAPPPPVVVAPAIPSSISADEGLAREREGSPSVAFATAEHALEASNGNCVAACRALGSMDRSTGRLCGLASSRDDARVCDDSKAKLRAARDRVRSACGSCPGGPTVDPNAPAPTP